MCAKQFFIYQLRLIKAAFIKSLILLGDFNIDARKKFENDYRNRDLFDEFDLALGELYLHQLVNFDTWSRVINNVRKSSTLDHIYCKDPTLIEGLTQISPIFGDHVIVLFNLRSITLLIYVLIDMLRLTPALLLY